MCAGDAVVAHELGHYVERMTLADDSIVSLHSSVVDLVDTICMGSMLMSSPGRSCCLRAISC